MKENIWDNLFDVRKYKRWIDETPDSECKICSANAKVWWIKREEVFPSWHFSPPAHPNCDCRLEYSNYKTNIDINTQIDTMSLSDASKEWNNILKEWEEDFKWYLDFISYLNKSRWWKKYDIKRRKEFKNKADKDLYVLVNWVKVRLDELGNFLVWRNWYLASKHFWRAVSYLGWNFIEAKKSLKRNYREVDFFGINIPYLASFELIPEDEIRDRRFYFIWNIYAKLEEITNDKKFLETSFVTLFKLAQDETISNKFLKEKATEILDKKKNEIETFKENKRKAKLEAEFRKDWQEEFIHFIKNRWWF